MSGSDSPKRQDLIEFLLEPSSYPHRPTGVTHLQTHASDVFIASPYVYKVKKPVNLGFLDFSTLEKRKHFCEVEVELNRRLCRGVYLGVEEITLGYEKLSIGGPGEAVEYAVRMREIPEGRFLANMLRKGDIGEGDLRRLARKLVDFYRDQPRLEEVAVYGLPERIRVNIDENLSLSRKFIDRTISRAAYDALTCYNERFFSENRELFLRRMKEGRIKDCHGDLHLDHISFSPDGICVFDCIEFNERFRYIDTASDIAFLAMDLDYNGYHGFSRFIVSETAREMDDEGIYGVIDFYKCYRAFVRGKVESIRAFEPEVPGDEKKASLERAMKYFRLALRYALFGSGPSVIVTFGIIGTGKSTLAAMLGEELSCGTLSSDSVRKEITGTKPGERRYEGWESGIYAGDITEKTYTEIIRRALTEIDTGGAVILDASFSRRKWRELLLREAVLRGANVYFVRTRAPVDEVELRLLRREKEGLSISDAGAALLPRFVAEWEEPGEIERGQMFVVDTNRPPHEMLNTLFSDIISAGKTTGQRVSSAIP